MPVARPEQSDARIIAHVDMDCFYVQVEQRKQPELRGLPTAVVQYNSWKGGGLIAVSYEARKYGVKRSMRGDEAKKVCPEIQLVQVPVARGKADLNIYRHAGSEVVSILARKGLCERASIDEVYLDLTDAAETMLSETPPEILEAINEETLKSHILGLNEDVCDMENNVRKWLCRTDADHRDKLLACGALIVAELRMQVLKETAFTCSAGIAHNKMLAKLASAMNKPAQQTVVPLSSVKGLLDSFPIKKMKQLGGKLGSSLQNELGVHTVGELLQFSEEKLQERYGINTGTWLWNIARGINGEEVEGRLLPKSHGSGKSFPGPRALKTIASVMYIFMYASAFTLPVAMPLLAVPPLGLDIGYVPDMAQCTCIDVEHWLNELCEELSERLQSDLDQNKRIAHTLTLHTNAYKSSDSDSNKKFPSKSCPLRYGTAKIQEDALRLFQAGLREYFGSDRVETQGNRNSAWRVTAISVTASKIVATLPGTCSILKFFHGQDPSSSSSKQPCDEIIQETVPLSPSGSESFSGLNQSESQKEFPKEETGISCARPSFTRDEQKKETRKYKGTSSILRFFHGSNPYCSSSKQACNEIVQDTELPFSGDQSRSDSCSELNQVELPKESPREETGTNIVRSSLGQDVQRRETWNYNVEEIDPSVIDELPPEIQEEVRGWLRPLKRANTAKRGSSIAHYFSPTKNK
ncbi:hypothetical protein HHK36_023158 [Tetracentron sinense]|uniref:DNA polymerase eta n=1 Tax=Tetracentron sinense TaxID=13715 RepID=A0A835D8F4_TETSI|nr:hypothetical protein HHK36_023158 [Tetracentron sinense]